MNNHFYVEHAEMVSDGLRNVGTSSAEYTPSNLHTIEGFAGAALGQGLYNISRKEKSMDVILSGIEHDDSFVRRCSALGLGLANLGTNSDPDLDLFSRLAQDENIDVKRTALISTGLANLGRGNADVSAILNPYLENSHWKLRSAAGLGYSFAFLGNEGPFERFVNLLENEESPYVKVCSCWYVSLSHARKNEFNKFVDLIERGDSFFRDMAALGMGFSHLGEGNTVVRDYLGALAKSDEHPYVRESSYFGLGLNDFRNPNDELTTLITSGLSDESPITRTGASLSLGLAHFLREDLHLGTLLENENDESVLWGASLSGGLSGNGPSLTIDNDYVNWGKAVGASFTKEQGISSITSYQDINVFQQNINEGLKRSGIHESDKNSLKLIYPGVSNYIIYESFWWGPWMLSSLGATMWGGENE